MKRTHILLLALLFFPAISFAETEQPPFEVKDPAITENFRNIYFAVDRLNLLTNLLDYTFDSTTNLLCVDDDSLCIDAITHSVSLRGTNTNDDADEGDYGEYTSTSATNLTGLPTSGQWGDCVSMSLTAGDWDVMGIVNFYLNGATQTESAMGISTTAGNSAPIDPTATWYGTAPTAAANITGNVPRFRLSIATTTTVYLKMEATYSLGSPQVRCHMNARRVR